MVQPRVKPSVSEVCIMEGRSRGECWGCPNLTCVLNVQPFSDFEETFAIAMRAVQKLRSNQIWLTGPDSKSGRQLLEELGDVPELELVARLYENRDRFFLNLAVEGVSAGVLAEKDGARISGHQGTSGKGSADNSFARFQEMVRERADLLGYRPEEGEQRHSRRHFDTD